MELTPRIKRRISRDFSAEDRQTVQEILLELVEDLGGGGGAGKERIVAATLLFSKGKVDKILIAVEVALEDWRDILTISGLQHVRLARSPGCRVRHGRLTFCSHPRHAGRIPLHILPHHPAISCVEEVRSEQKPGWLGHESDGQPPAKALQRISSDYAPEDQQAVEDLLLDLSENLQTRGYLELERVIAAVLLHGEGDIDRLLGGYRPRTQRLGRAIGFRV